jgi:trans-2,3-dihydro-3-hydroxyanthranilate isomerase
VVRAEAAARLRLRLLSAAFRFTWLDVFTAVPCEGNGLAVVHGADELDDDAMLAFARETRLSETTFIQRPTARGADYRNRIWTTAGEIPFAGHPSLGTAIAVARERGEETARYVQQTSAGLQPVEVRLDRDRGHASMHQEPPWLGPALEPAHVLAAAGLEAGDASPDLPPQVVSTGVPQVIAPVADVATLQRSRPQVEALSSLLTQHGAITLYLVAGELREGAVRARAFFPAGGGSEDPATGSAAGPLCAYLAERMGVSRIDITQGVEMGRPSRLRAEMDGDRPRVSGAAVVLVEGTLRL